MGAMQLRNFPCEELTTLHLLGGFIMLVVSQLHPTWSVYRTPAGEERVLDGFFDLGCNPWTCQRQQGFDTPTSELCIQYSKYVSCHLVRATRCFAVAATLLGAVPLFALVIFCVNKRAPEPGNDRVAGNPEDKFRLAKRCAQVGGGCALLACLLWLFLEVQLEGWLASLRNAFAPGIAGTLEVDTTKNMWLGPGWLMAFFGGLLQLLGALFAHCMPILCRHVVFAAETLPEATRPAAPNRLQLDGCTVGRPHVPKARVSVRDCVPGAGAGRLAQIV